MSTHTYWRVYAAANASSPLGAAISCAELEMHSTGGGGNICSGGTAISDCYYPGYPPANAFDGNVNTLWSGENGSPNWLGYHFASPVNVVEIKWTARNDSQYAQSPTSMFLQFSDDGVNWLCYQQSDTTATWASAGQAQTFGFASPYTWPAGPYVGVGSGTTFNPSDLAGSPNTPVLSGGNLTMTGNGSGGASGNSWARGIRSQSAAKLYFEFAFISSTGEGLRDAVGIANSGTPFSGANNLAHFGASGQIFVNTQQIATNHFLTFTGACTIGIAVNGYTNQCWCRVDGGYWNASSSADPVAGVGGVSISAITTPWFPIGNVTGNSTHGIKINSSGPFCMPVPTGYFPGWPSYLASGGQLAMLNII